MTVCTRTRVPLSGEPRAARREGGDPAPSSCGGQRSLGSLQGSVHAASLPLLPRPWLLWKVSEGAGLSGG